MLAYRRSRILKTLTSKSASLFSVFQSFFSTTATLQADYSHVVVGGGAVGLAVASKLSENPSNSVLVVEKNSKIGQETSSRNSEVIHSGIYYPIDSLKSKLCIRGKDLIYSEALKNGVEMDKCGKWIVAQTDKEDSYLENLHLKAKELNVETQFVPLWQTKMMEPSINANRSVLNSPSTGIINADSLMNYLLGKFENNSGDLAVHGKVIGLSFEGNEYKITVDSTEYSDSSSSQITQISSENLINSAGLNAVEISNLLLPESRHLKAYYAKGNYFSFNRNFPKVSRLVYPVPNAGLSSLGTHLTIDLGGKIKFGPDIEWIENPTNYNVNDKNIETAFNEIIKYFPNIMIEDLTAAYSGIRPKLNDPNDPNTKGKFQDFVIKKEDDFPGFVNLLGIESPGLTSSMGIAEYVYDLYHK
ncbi:NAD(P)/FAD-dependent oxidoreductase [Ascoidea rubescens DSM 1968]|uniref:L-2-hydroxyglutarate dehydrogenase, mitochondrial n=1 Tax=Ascoidea rubescens DSM 1968 TaxID=1344418 RepID=A0A1D2VPA1_9ASCO|nr:FAD dependent oxidoreductase [Ascoidea rubescens DSM 1968]ODV63429.1 FAD dependent oxidoreductase [Ascoidea rubescens DSM 1968]